MPYRFRKFAQGILDQENYLFSPKRTADISSVIVYPNTYEMGINNLGFQTVYRQFNQIDDIYAERAFLYPSPFEKEARTLESNRSIAEFDLIAFSLAYELDFINVARILKNAAIPLFASDRNGSYPLIVAGGMVMFMNPAPLAPFLDVVFVGEAEGLVEPFVAILEEALRNAWKRNKILNELAKMEGLYIPQIHETAIPESIVRHYRPKHWNMINHSSVLTPQGLFKDMFLIEVGRGCPRGCRFCAAGYVYRPYRINGVQEIKDGINSCNLRHKSVGLVGSAVSDFPKLSDLMASIIAKKGRLGVSSLRLDQLTETNIELLEKGGLKSVAVAPEAGSERLRNIINKNITEADILRGAQLVAHSKLMTLKLYFMIGLPFEEDQDIEAIVELMTKINDIYNENGATGMIKISCNAFVPKAFTPFQWSPMVSEKEVKIKRDYLIKGLHRLNKVQFNPLKSIKESILQGILSLGDQNSSRLVEKLCNGSNNWKRRADEIGFKYESIIYQAKGIENSLPWDFIRGAVPKAMLWKEYMRAQKSAMETS